MLPCSLRIQTIRDGPGPPAPQFFHAQGDRQTDSRIRQTYQSLFHWHDFQLKLFWEGIVVGIFAGLVNSLFRWGLTEAETLRLRLYDF